MHCIAGSTPACVIVGRHTGSGAARWLPWESSNILRKIPEMAIKRNFTYFTYPQCYQAHNHLNLTVLVTTIDAQWVGIGDIGSARYEPALLPPCPTIRVLSCSN